MLHLPDQSGTAMAIEVRRLQRCDARSVGRLHRDACAERIEHRGGGILVAGITRGSGDAPLEESFIDLIDEPGVVVLVAELVPRDDPGELPREPLGHLVMRYGPQDSRMSELAVLEELYVAPDARNIGLGSALLDAAKRIAGTAGCTGLDAVALPGDRATKNFFEDHAMVARAIIVHTALDSQAEPER